MQRNEVSKNTPAIVWIRCIETGSTTPSIARGASGAFRIFLNQLILFSSIPGMHAQRPSVIGSPQHPHREHEDCPDQLQHTANGDPNNPERQQNEPHQRIEHKSNERKGPAQHEQNAKEQKFHHGYTAFTQPFSSKWLMKTTES